MEIGERLKEERERLGYNQADFAAFGGASKASQSSWEAGTAFPNAKFLAAIAERGADVGYILTGKRGAESVQEAPAEYVAEQKSRDVLALYEALDAEGRAWMVNAGKRELRRFRAETTHGTPPAALPGSVGMISEAKP